MSQDISPMHEYFAKLGLEPEIADIYLALQAYGPQSVMQLARNAKIERTRLYRLIDTLADAHLLEVEVHYKRNIYKAAPVANLQILLTRKEQELRELHSGLHDLQQSIQTPALHSPLTHVQFYKGKEGLKQMFWNQTKSKTENLSILYENMQNKTNLSYFERWVDRCNSLQITFRSIVSDHFLSTQQEWYSGHGNERLQFWQGRYVSDVIFPITHSMVTYDDVVAYYNWKGGEIFGVEIYNQQIADAQKHFFEMLWQQGEPLKNGINS